MVGSNGTMIAIRLVRSKLRKREDHANAQHPEPVVQTATPGNNVVSQTTTTTTSSSSPVDGCCTQTTVLTTTTTTTTAVVTMDSNGVEPDPIFTTNTATAEQFIWQFPPPYPPLNTPPPQYTLYNDQVSLSLFNLCYCPWESKHYFFFLLLNINFFSICSIFNVVSLEQNSAITYKIWTVFTNLVTTWKIWW